MIYDSVNDLVLDHVPSGLRNVLDLGCGGGSLGRVIRERTGARVTGVTFSEQEATAARAKIDAVVVADLNALDPSSLGGPFDGLVCSHVLEHLADPGRLLSALRTVLTPDAVVVVALPNVLFWKQRVQFLSGRFRYTDGGLMDRTHYRFFDWRSAAELLTDNGYVVESAVAGGILPMSRFIPGLERHLNRWAVRAAPGFFGWQFVLRARLDPKYQSL